MSQNELVELAFKKKCLEIVQHLDGCTMEEIDRVLTAVRVVASCMASVDCSNQDYNHVFDDVMLQLRAS